MRTLLLALLFLPGCYLSHERPDSDPACDARLTVENADESRTIPIGGTEVVGRFRMRISGDLREPIIMARLTLGGLFSFPHPMRIRVMSGSFRTRWSPDHLLFESEVTGPGEIFPVTVMSGSREWLPPAGHVDLFVIVDTTGLHPSMTMRVTVSSVIYGDPFSPSRTCVEPVVGPTMLFASFGECRLGETRSCYSGPAGTEGVGRCHGSMHTCVLGPFGATEWDYEPPDCVGEVTPYPWGDLLTGDDIGVDDDCDGEVDERDFSFCGEFGPSTPPERFGYTGCCTRAAFMTRSDVPPAGTLIKGSDDTVYFLSEDGRRHVFPTSLVLASWYQEPGVTMLAEHGPVICPQVVQLPDEVFASIPLSSINVTFRPGSVTTGIESILAVRYAVTQGAVLREMRIGYRFEEVCPVRIDSRHLMLDTLFGNYTLGAPITALGEYDACAEADTTLEEELARRAP